MSAPTQAIIAFRKPPKPPTYTTELRGALGYPGPPYTVGHIVEAMYGQPVDDTVLMHRVTWFFPRCTFEGLRHRDYVNPVDGERGVLVDGYRCEVCNLVFFGPDLEDFRHSCMDGEA
jgi:hypothetical protein